MLLEGQLFGLLARGSRCWRWWEPTWRMGKACWFCGDLSALLRGKVTILVGRDASFLCLPHRGPVCGCPMIGL